jgi:stage 0 sporulation regulatory protein
MEEVFVKSLLDEKALLTQISIKRKDMYRKAKNFGLTHPIVVSCSQELDVLLNNYQKKVS